VVLILGGGGMFAIATNHSLNCSRLGATDLSIFSESQSKLWYDYASIQSYLLGLIGPIV